MTTRYAGWGAFLAICLASGALFAQAPDSASAPSSPSAPRPAPEPEAQTLNANAADDDSLSAMAEAMRRLESKVNGLSDKYVTREEFQKLQEIVNRQTQALDTLQSLLAEQGATIRQIDSKYESSIAALNEQSEQINSILNAISRNDSQNKPILNIASAMASQDFQRDLADAVDNSLREQRPTGRLTITNNMPYAQGIRVNGAYHYINPGATRAFSVPVGTVTTELDGEAPKNWVIAPPNYNQGIIIAPRNVPIVLTTL